MSTSRTQQLAEAVANRLTHVGALRGAAAGLVMAAVLALRALLFVPLEAVPPSFSARVGAELALAALLALSGVLFGGWWQRRRQTPAQIAEVIEQGVPASHNLLRTALELQVTGAPGERAPVAALVATRADALASTIDARLVVPTRRATAHLVGAVIAWVAAVGIGQLVPAGAVGRTATRTVAVATQRSSISRVDVAVTPPAYAQQPPRAQRDPDRIEGLEGSRLTFRVASNADSLRIETADSVRTLARPARGDFTWDAPLRDDGFVALTPFTTQAGPKRLVAISMLRDGGPSVRITAPGKDLVVPTPDRTLDVRIDATDDVGLGSLELHYTKVSGSGERFEFTEGTVPVRVTRDGRTHWTASAALALKALLVEPGDLVVYRARATDARPGREPVESDAFIAQLAEAGGVAATGFSMDPDEDRYAVSQQMVIQKTERLIAGQKALAADTVKERASQIAVEQRRVRAEFVFMTGGEFEAGVVEGEEGGTALDETAEAEGEQDLAAGRMVNRGRQALLVAIRAMSRASIALTESRLTDALRYEKTALTNLQEAFARQRFLMRALSQREALDPARRHSGALDSVARAPVVTPPPERDETRAALRGILAALLTPPALATRDRDTELAVRVLQLRPTRPDAQRIAQWLTRAAAQPAAATSLRDSAATALTSWMARSAPRDGQPLPTAAALQRRALHGARP
jgi:DNA-binding transcriptional regulator YdaS (Cro superfamily)